MAHISSIGAGLFSDLSVCTAVLSAPQQATAAADAKATFDALMDTAAEIVRIKNVREFPAMGTPPNIVNVPVYGQKSSQQIQGQSDAPSLEIQLNYVAADWASGSTLGTMVGDGLPKLFRFALMNAAPVSALAANEYASSALGIGTTQNSYYYWIGKIEALLVTPQLTDANTATLTLSIQSPFFGAYTV
jgi:hypothetical protein